MTSSIESFNVRKHTPLYENEQNERAILQWLSIVICERSEKYHKMGKSSSEGKRMFKTLGQIAFQMHKLSAYTHSP